MSTIRFDEDLVVLDQPFETKEEVVTALAERLLQKGYVHPTYRDAVLTREQSFPTGLPTQPVGVAIPHADPEHCRIPALAVARLPHPVAWGLMGDETETVQISIVFLLALTAEKQVEFLSQLAALFQTPETLAQMLACTTPKRVVEFVQAKVNLQVV